MVVIATTATLPKYACIVGVPFDGRVPICSVRGAEGRLVGRVAGPHLEDPWGRRVATLSWDRTQKGGLLRTPERRELARLHRDAAGVELRFHLDAQVNPFLQMLLLAAV